MTFCATVTRMSSSLTQIIRPPVVVVMGHIDHGKSTLLDYIRKSNVVGGEAGGITQHLSAYEVLHKDETGVDRTITFLDTPGHEAFSTMRARGAQAADIAILVVSAEDGVKAQTLEAWKTIVESKTPYFVAINKIDKPGANIEKTKMDLAENGIYLEGYGGDVPAVMISAKVGTGIDTLLDTIILVADLHELAGNPKIPATGYVIESNMDPKRGISATLIIKNGSLNKGQFVVVDDAFVGTRIVEDFLGKQVSHAQFSSPIRITGFSKEPRVGSRFSVWDSKKEAEQAILDWKRDEQQTKNNMPIVYNEGVVVVPLIIKTDVAGTGEAVEKEIKKLEKDTIVFKILDRSIGAISERDIALAQSDDTAIIVGFHVKIDPKARDMNEQAHVTIATFDIIYKLSDFLKEEVTKRKPRVLVESHVGTARVLKTFNGTKDKQIVGAKMENGLIAVGSEVKVLRRDIEICRGKIVELQEQKTKVKQINEGSEFGALLEAKHELAPGDILEAFNTKEE